MIEPRVIGFESATARQQVKVLLVEDNEDDVEMVRRVFRRSGVGTRIRVARDGEQALDTLRASARGPRAGAGPPHVILLDLKLPKLDGIDLLRELRRDPRLASIPVVVLSGSAGRDVIGECLSLGITHYVIKPLDLGDIATMIARLQRKPESDAARWERRVA